MTAVIHPQADRRIGLRLNDRIGIIVLVLGATALTLLTNAGLVTETLHGRFADPDDAMRLVEVRAWLSGQTWFDMNAARLDPPQGSLMHWSRLVDLPVAAMIKIFGIVTDPARAERLAAVAVPTAWLAALYLGMARLAIVLCGRAALFPALLGTFLSGATLVQFAPGRIGHHAPETVALVYAVGCAVVALDRRRAREALACGALVALSLAMSLETLPFDVALAGVLMALWAWRGAALAAPMGWFGAGLLLTLPTLFLATVGVDLWGAPVCDDYGAAHLGAGLIGATGALALALLTSRLGSPIRRLAALVAVGTCVAAYVALAYPACLRSPFAAVDPLVRDLWLNHVVESQPLAVFMRGHAMIGLAIVGPIALGFAGCLAAAASTSATIALRFSILATLSAVCLGLAFWQVRVLGSGTPLALCGGLFLVKRLGETLEAKGLAVAAKLAPLAILAFTSTIWVIALPGDVRSEAAASEAKAACISPEALAPLAALPPGSVVAPLDSGAHLLEATQLSVFAAPYHRNDDGNRFAFDVFLAAPDKARALLDRRHVTYVMTCPGLTETDRIVARAPAGLAALLNAGDVPGFLKPVAVAGTRYKVYAMTPDGR